MTLGDRIQEQRKRRGLSQEKLAELVGVSRQAVTKWEAGQSVPTCENLMALSDLFQMPLDTLVSGTPPEGAAERGRRRPNPILRTNLTMLAISFQAGALHACTQVTYTWADGVRVPDRGVLLFKIALLFLTSVWMASNLRFEKDLRQRRKNSLIELAYCTVQLAAAFLTYRFGMGLVGLLLTVLICLGYLLIVNPRYMNRKLTR